MKILSKVIWAVDFDESHSRSLDKVRYTAELFNSEIILLHVLPREVDGASYQGRVEKAIMSDLGEIAKELCAVGDCVVNSRIAYGNVVEKILDVAEEEDVNLIFVNRGRASEASGGQLGLNAQKVVRNAGKPVLIINDLAPVERPRVLCPVDFSEPSSLALESAILYARKTSASLTVMTVFQPIRITSARLLNAGLDEEGENKQRFLEVEESLREYLANFNLEGIDVQTEVVKGVPHEEIIWQSHRATIIYMGSTGKTGLRRSVLGSVTEKVIREAECNVAVVKTEDIFKLRIPTELEDIEKHLRQGHELVKLGFIDEAISQYHMCLRINDLHLPSIWALAAIYEKKGKGEKQKYYEDLAGVITEKMTNLKIEEEIRRTLRSVD